MSNWKELSLIQKVFIGLFIAAAAFVGPEMMFLLDIGGIELACSALFLYFKPLIDWLQPKIKWISIQIHIAKIAFVNSAVFKSKVFTTHAVFCSVAMVLTGSFILSVGFFLPALLANGMLV